MGDFVVQECCVHGTDLESHSPTSILCDDPLPLLTTIHYLLTIEYLDNVFSCRYNPKIYPKFSI